MPGMQGPASTAPGPWDSRPKVQQAQAYVPGSAHSGTRNFLAAFGALILFLIISTPLWNATRLMSDPTIVFFLGESFAVKTIILCCGAIVFWVILIFLFFRCSREEGLTELSVTNLTILTLTGLGLGMLLISTPFINQVETQYEELMNCDSFNPSIAKLTAYSSVLEELRQTPACSKMPSIEDCEGYEASNPWTGFLQSMETQFKCAGFCYTPPSVATASNASATSTSGTGSFYKMPAATSLKDRVLQASFKSRVKDSQHSATEEREHSGHKHVGRKSQSDHEPVMFLMAATEELERVDANGQVSNSKEAKADSKPSPYPPTLFTQANYQASCDGMAARDVKYAMGDSVWYLYIEGSILILISVFVGLFKMCHLCHRTRASEKYGY